MPDPTRPSDPSANGDGATPPRESAAPPAPVSGKDEHEDHRDTEHTEKKASDQGPLIPASSSVISVSNPQPEPVSRADAAIDQPAPEGPSPRRTWAGGRRTLKSFGVRAYAVALLVVIGLLGYRAFDYLVRLVFNPPGAPRELVDFSGHLTADALRAEHVAGVTGPAARAPLAHYHRIEQWYQPDPYNGCTVTGCHGPLPHTKADKAPAFATFPTTFLACETCHVNGSDHPAPAGWVAAASGKPTGIPAVLQLTNLLESDVEAIKSRPAEAHPQLLRLLKSIASAPGADPLMEELLVQIDTAQPGSPVWRHAVAQLKAELPQHTRGEYHAKIARQGAENTPKRFEAAQREARRCLAATAESDQRKQLHADIHGGLLKQSVTCLACHGDQPALLDLEALGYSPMRADYLKKLEVARMMQQVRQGERFYLPRLLEGSNGR